MRIVGIGGRRGIVRGVAALIGCWAATATAASAQPTWPEANHIVGALGGWRQYAKERAEPPDGYPTVPAESEVLGTAEVLAAELSLDNQALLAGWESRRYAQRSAPLAPPSLSFARTSGELESSSEVGVHLPVGAWIQRMSSLAADTDTWGAVERRALERQATRNRLVAFADAVAAKAELAQAMDRLEVQAILEELTRRQREIDSVPAFELLNLRIERTDAQEAEALAREASLRTAERLALEMRLPLSEAPELQRRLPLILPPADPLPKLAEDGRLDVGIAEEALAQRRTSLERARSAAWTSGLEIGLVQERFDSGEENNTLELSWRLPFGGDPGRQVDLGERVVREAEAQLRAVRQDAQRELREATRAFEIAELRLLQSAEALDAAEVWMEEQVYRYSGMLIGPHDILRAATRLRQVQSRHIAAQRQAFVAAVDAHFVRAIPTRALIPAQSRMPASAADAAH